MKQETDKEVSELLRHVEPGQLTQFIAQYATKYASFKKDILGHFRPHETQKSITDYRKAVAAVFSFEDRSGYRRGYDFYEAANTAEDALYDMVEKAKYLASQNNYQEASAIAQSVIEVIPRNYELVDDSRGGLGGVFNDAVAQLLSIVENEMADKALKKEIFYWTGKEVKEKIYSDYGFDAIESLLIPCTQAAGLFNEALDIAEERIQQAGSDYRLERAVMDKIQLLQQNNLSHEIESTINQHIDLAEIRKIKIASALEKNHYPEGIMLIKEGIKVAEKKDYPGTVSDWKDQLLSIYMILKDRTQVLKYAEDLFYNGREAKKYYHILKKETEPENWVTYLDKLLSSRKTSRFPGGYPDNVLADIYIEEKYWDRLLQLIEKAGIRGIEPYEKYLKPRFPNELVNLYVQQITEYAEQNMGRNQYQYVASILTKLRSYPEGNGTVDKLLTEFKVKYKARKAMMEELRKV